MSNTDIADYTARNNTVGFNEPSIAKTYGGVNYSIQNAKIDNIQTFDTNGNPVAIGVTAPVTDSIGLYPVTGPASANQASTETPNKDVRVQSTRSDKNKPEPSAQPPVASKETMALVQKGYYQQPSMYGDQQLKNSLSAFNNAVGTAVGFASIASTIKLLSESQVNKTVPFNKYTNYYLTDVEKQMVRSKAATLAANGIVPYDALEEFLFILVTVDNITDLDYIATVAGITEINGEQYVRNVKALLGLKELYRISYLANAVDCINRRFDPKFGTAYNGANSSSSKIAPILMASTAAGMIAQFPIVNILSQQIGSIVSTVAQKVGMMALFSTLPSLSGGALSTGFSQATSMLGGLASGFSNIGNELKNVVTSIIGAGVRLLMPIVGVVRQLIDTIKNMANVMSQLGAVSTVPRDPEMIKDVTNQFSSLQSIGSSILGGLRTILNTVGQLAGPAISGFAVSQLIGKNGGYLPGTFMTMMTIGQAMPISVLTKNPTLQSPSYAGKAFFGESPAAFNAVDQMFSKRVAAYPSASNGSAAQSFGLQNYGSFGGTASLTDIVAKVTLGLSAAPTIGTMADYCNTVAAKAANVIGCQPNSIVEVRRSDNSLPMMVGVGAALCNDTKSPFSIDEHQAGWKMSSSVSNDLQRHSRDFLETCRVSM